MINICWKFLFVCLVLLMGTAAATGETRCKEILVRNEAIIPNKKLIKTDLRFKVQQLAKISVVLNQLDLFSSPATLKPIIFTQKSHNLIFEFLNQQSIYDTEAMANISKDLLFSKRAKIALQIFISRFRVATGVLNLIAHALGDSGLRIESTFQTAFDNLLNKYLIELLVSGKISEFEIQHMRNKINSMTFIFDSKTQIPAVSQADFQTTILNSFSVDEPLEQNLRSMANQIDIELRQLPVGISFGMSDLTSNVRFGDFHFFSSWFVAKTSERKVFLRHTQKDGLVEFTLRLTASQKKRVALLLDRTDDQLDPIFSSTKKQAGNFIQTCGTYASSIFLRCGVPIISPSYTVASPAIFSLWIQSKLGLGPVEKVNMSGINRITLIDAIFDIMLHDSVAAFAEVATYGGLMYFITTRLADVLM